MTIDEQLRQMAGRAEAHQQPISVEEIMERASSQSSTHVLELSPPTTSWSDRRRWLLVAAAAVVTVAGLAQIVVDADGDPGPARTVTGTPPAALDGLIHSGSIVFAADAGAGAALTDRVDHQRIETVPEPMDLYLTRAGAASRRLVSSEAHERCPAFSPDGRRLAYLSVLAGSPSGSYPETGPPLDASLVIIRLDEATGTNDPELVVQFPAATGYGVRREVGYPCPQWSPDGTRVAYLAHPVEPSNVHADVAELRVVTLDGHEQVVTAGTTADYRSTIAWSPTGDAIAYVRDDGVWSATLDGRAPSSLWHSDRAPTAVSWSARGELAVTVPTEDPIAGLEIHIVDLGAGTSTSPAERTPNSGPARWSPDGSQLAFVRHDGRIVLSDRDRGTTVALPLPRVDDHDAPLGDVGWSPDGDQLLAIALYSRVDFSRPQPDFMNHPGQALLSLSIDGTLIDVLTPWTWAFDWIDLRDVDSYPTPQGR